MNTPGQIAQVCHAANKAYCESLLDFSTPRWEDLPLEKKDSLVSGVKLHLSNPNSKPEDGHNAWLATMKKNGWIYLEEKKVIKRKGKKDKIIMVPAPKDYIRKNHPCLVAYDKLPKEQQFKDSLFIAVVRAFAPVAAPKKAAEKKPATKKEATPKKPAAENTVKEDSPAKPATSKKKPVTNKGSNVHEVQAQLREPKVKA